MLCGGNPLSTESASKPLYNFLHTSNYRIFAYVSFRDAINVSSAVKSRGAVSRLERFK